MIRPPPPFCEMLSSGLFFPDMLRKEGGLAGKGQDFQEGSKASLATRTPPLATLAEAREGTAKSVTTVSIIAVLSRPLPLPSATCCLLVGSVSTVCRPDMLDNKFFGWAM